MKTRQKEAATLAISSPLLETSIKGARGIIINVTASPDIGLDEVTEASTLIQEEAHPDATVIWGAAFDESLNDEMRITVIATGFDSAKDEEEKAEQEEVKEEKKEDVLADDEFDVILSMLDKSGKNFNTNGGATGNNGFNTNNNFNF